MAEPTDAEADADPDLDEDDVPAHRYMAPGVRFSVNVNYGGHSAPYYFVTLDELGGEGRWWFDPEEAERLGQLLVELGARTRQSHADEERRRQNL